MTVYQLQFKKNKKQNRTTDKQRSYGPHQAVTMDNIFVDTHNRHQMCIHLTLLSNQRLQVLESGHPKKEKANNKQCIKLKSTDLHMRALILFFPTPNEKFEVENNSVYCAVF